jgi:hypothetical protein
MTDSRYKMAAKLVVNMVVEIVASRHSWNLNEAMSRFSKSHVYELLADTKTKLWMDNPSDIADLFDKEYAGEQLTVKDFIYG